MKNLSELNIKQENISVILSGLSVEKLIESGEIDEIKDNSFMITVNYAPVKIDGHMNMWSDKEVSRYLNTLYVKKEKESLFLSRPNAFTKQTKHDPIYYNLDYMFDEKTELSRQGNYTAVWLIALLHKYFPLKNILLFGLDMTEGPDASNAKWYDKYTDFDIKKRGKSYPVKSKLNQCQEQLRKHCGFPNIYNCNLNSGTDIYVKKEWREIVNVKNIPKEVPKKVIEVKEEIVVESENKMDISNVKEFWENDNFKNIKPTSNEFPEGFDVLGTLKKIANELNYESIVELGCGYGRLSTAFDKDKYIGTDISDRACDKARVKNPTYTYQEYSHPKADIYLAYTVFLHLTDEQVHNELKQINSKYFIISEILGNEWANNGKGGVPTYNRELEQYNSIMKEHGYELSYEVNHLYKRYENWGRRNKNIYFLVYKRTNI